MFIIIAIAVWVCALVIWWVCSNAFRHSDLDKLKSRLLGENPNVKRFSTNVAMSVIKQGLSIPIPLDQA